MYIKYIQPKRQYLFFPNLEFHVFTDNLQLKKKKNFNGFNIFVPKESSLICKPLTIHGYLKEHQCEKEWLNKESTRSL